jgi:valyl-tRNA synthetase
MKELGLVEKIEPHINRVGVSYRSKATIEPYMSKQWFVKMEAFGKKLRAVVDEGRTQIIPKNWENTYYHWIDNLRDWCISRQLWWGHRIPIWYNVNDPQQMICWDGEGAPPQADQHPEQWRQDEDVLDTWFSSALWPFSSLGWPDKTPELERFYPNSVLVTGHDILFFWVARMLLMGEYAMHKPPFPQVFLHGLIYGKSYWRNQAGGGIAYLGDAERKEYELGKPLPGDVHCKWEKMSKSKGNIIDPLEIIDEYGTDAMRMALCASATQAREIDLDRRRFEEFKNFANKVWNGARFIFMNLDGDSPLTAEMFSQGLDEKLLGLEDRWILSKLNTVIDSVNKKLADYLFDQAAVEAYEFFWKDFCSSYLEIVKPTLFGKEGSPETRANKQKLLAILLCNTVRLIHPMAPFITEELFQRLKQRLAGCRANGTIDPYTKEAIDALNSPACIVAPYPHVVRQSDIDPAIEADFSLIDTVVYTIRNIRGEMKLPPSTATAVHIVGDQSDPDLRSLGQHKHLIAALVRTTSIDLHNAAPEIGFASTGVIRGITIAIPLPEELLKQEQARLAKEKDRLLATISRMQTQLANTDFVANAPAQLVEKQKTQLQQAERELAEIENKLQLHCKK